jgi:hypothetical protein
VIVLEASGWGPLRAGDGHLLIDFNPRFDNQLAFDVARGLPLPGMV